MAVAYLPIDGLEAAPSAENRELRFVSRQPILDAKGVARAYALQFRSRLGEGAGRDAAQDPERATCSVADQALVYGFDRLTGGLPAFVVCTADSLNKGIMRVLPPSLTVLEFQEAMQPTPELIASCHLFKAAGYRLAFGNFCWERRFGALMRIADYVKVDCRVMRVAGMSSLQQRAGGHATTWVAKNVESQEDFRRARDEGFTLFQGYYFCSPELLRNRAIPANRVAQIKILDYLHNRALDMHQLSRLVMADAGLTYRLLRLVNSPLFPVRREISSVEAALMVVGEEAFRRMMMLALASELNGGGSVELLRLALVRARFCEQVATWCQVDPEEQYLVGLLSLLPAMLRVAMEDLTPTLPLRLELRDALLGATNAEGRSLRWLEAYERGQWARCTALLAGPGTAEVAYADRYMEAIFWSEVATHFVH